MEQYIYNQIKFLCRNYCNNNGELLLNIADEYEDIIRNGFKPNDYGITNINDIPLYLEWGVMLYGFFLKYNKVLALVDDFHTGPPEPYEYELEYIPIELLELAIQIIINENHEILDYMEQKHHYIGLTDAQVLESRRKMVPMC